MKFYNLVLIFLFFSFREENVKGDSCDILVAKMVKKQFANVDICLKELGLHDGKRLFESTDCITKCVLMKEEMITKDGFADPSHFTDYLMREIPEKLHDKVLSLGEKCAHVINGKLDLNEKDCKSFGPIFECVVEFFPYICDECKTI